jgi:hypothetical protein
VALLARGDGAELRRDLRARGRELIDEARRRMHRPTHDGQPTASEPPISPSPSPPPLDEGPSH